MLLTCALALFLADTTPATAFQIQSTTGHVRSPRQTTRLNDVESEVIAVPELPLQSIFKKPALTDTHPIPLSADKKECQHGMPWKKSIDPSYKGSPLYMPFRNWQAEFMQKNLQNLRIRPVLSRKGQDMSYVESKDKNIRMHTSCFQSDEYKLIRMTTIDGGDQLQVFTSLFYPRTNMPVFGIDLLMFHQKKVLCIADFQAIHEREDQHDVEYESRMRAVRDQYPLLQGKMTGRFYDETQFFSSQMLLGRCNREDLESPSENPLTESSAVQELVYQNMFPAVQQYTETHLELLRELQSKQKFPNANYRRVHERHVAYDKYSASRDPAHGLLAFHFGKDFAHDYVHDILFPLSTTS